MQTLSRIAEASRYRHAVSSTSIVAARRYFRCRILSCSTRRPVGRAFFNHPTCIARPSNHYHPSIHPFIHRTHSHTH
ncbi:hypothetical protein VTO73DRAFT_6670 [Trametes versicolor]